MCIFLFMVFAGFGGHSLAVLKAHSCSGSLLDPSWWCLGDHPGMPGIKLSKVQLLGCDSWGLPPTDSKGESEKGMLIIVLNL